MARCFNTVGPCNAATHYLLPVLRRLPEVHRLIEQQCFWVLHAPRQVGKRTVLRALAEDLTASGDYAALHVSCIDGVSAGENFADAQRTLLSCIRHGAEFHLPAELRPPPFPGAPKGTLLFLLGAYLSPASGALLRRTRRSDRPELLGRTTPAACRVSQPPCRLPLLCRLVRPA